jgi:hypothetical protein
MAHDILSPPVASRFYVYTNIVALEITGLHLLKKAAYFIKQPFFITLCLRVLPDS